MPIGSILSGVADLTNAGTNFTQMLYDFYNSERNYKLQHKQYDLEYWNMMYQRQLQQQIFNREDNAVQRRAADLKAAGFNPLLAAGGAASAGQAVSSVPPSQAPQHSRVDMLGLAKMAQDISMSKAQQELLNSQSSLADGQAELSRKQAELQQMTIDWYRNHPGYAPGVESGLYTGKGISSIISGVSNRVQSGRQAVQDWKTRKQQETGNTFLYGHPNGSYGTRKLKEWFSK